MEIIYAMTFIISCVVLGVLFRQIDIQLKITNILDLHLKANKEENDDEKKEDSTLGLNPPPEKHDK
ncbi:hypothetical protein DRW41_08185 [Neobacillus piezotolerans]|uniref:Uncharacterized protein n=1 Tax=Neobacillus piezotolerans TaxID=2259171 RepID=A0A3D8GTJ3_9BACI|nr:hypothetical protein [Neobacillus piezotolerans]RDU37790.1 hypothetical protein DRW41_08185 [Neobacillus piezotolerans]